MDHLAEFVVDDGFDEEGEGAELDGLAGVGEHVVGGDDEHRHAGADAAQEVEPAVDIGEEQLAGRGGEAGEGLGGVRGIHVKAVVGEELRKGVEEGGVLKDEEQAGGQAGAAWAWGRICVAGV